MKRRRTVRQGRHTIHSCVLVALSLALALTLAFARSAPAATAVPLGTADSFALLAGSTITNTGATTISGDIGLCCSGAAIANTGTITQPSGATYIGTGSPAFQAQADLTAAYDSAATQAPTAITPVELSNTSATALTPGVYDSVSAGGGGVFGITNDLYLDFLGDPNSVFIFRATSVVTGTDSRVFVTNAGGATTACNVFWRLSDPTQGVTLGVNSSFLGTALALGQSTLNSGATVNGRILTRDSKQVTLDNNTITRIGCAPPASSGGGDGSGTATEPADTSPAPTDTSTDSPPASTPTPTPTGSSTPTRPSGFARLTAPNGPVSGPFRVSVTGRGIKAVAFFVDGRWVRTVLTIPGRTKYTHTINPRGQSMKVHRVTARVIFAPTTRSTSTSLRGIYWRARSSHAPQFTG